MIRLHICLVIILLFKFFRLYTSLRIPTNDPSPSSCPCPHFPLHLLLQHYIFFQIHGFWLYLPFWTPESSLNSCSIWILQFWHFDSFRQNLQVPSSCVPIFCHWILSSEVQSPSILIIGIWWVCSMFWPLLLHPCLWEKD